MNQSGRYRAASFSSGFCAACRFTGRGGLGASPANPAAAKSSLPANESLWDLVKGQFILREGLILMNAANLCPSPIPVMETVFEYIRDEDRDASFQNREKH